MSDTCANRARKALHERSTRATFAAAMKNGANLSLLAAMCVAVLLASWGGCKKNGAPPAAPPKTPSLRVYVVSNVAGALEPCGCQKDMLGGVDHAAAYLQSQRGEAPHSVVLGAGPMLFMDPTLEEKGKQQTLWKAEALAHSFADMKLSAWAPGANDFAAGADRLAKLRADSSATLLASNLKGKSAGAESVMVRSVGGLQVGTAGVAAPKHPGGIPSGLEVADPEAALRDALGTLKQRGAQVRIALASLQRGEALRLAEKVPGFHLMIVGKPSDAGDANDGRTPPVLIGDTLVVQTPNHLQAMGVVDYYVRDDDFTFVDAAGVGQGERRASLERRVAELKKRIKQWEKRGVAEKDLSARRKELRDAEAELIALRNPKAPEKGSFFRYSLVEVREKLGADGSVEQRLKKYYKRVNDYNKVAYADRKPPPVEEGKAEYVGITACAGCHPSAKKFWDGTKHAAAYETLEKDFKEFNLDCVGCHVTGYEKPGGSTVTHVSKLKDVQCEVCHGPGSLHVEKPEKLGLITPSPARSLCAPACHHPPHVGEDWDVNEAWPHIIGPGHGKPVEKKPEPKKK